MFFDRPRQRNRFYEAFVIFLIFLVIAGSECTKPVRRSRYGGRIAAVVFFLVFFGLLFWLFPPTRL